MKSKSRQRPAKKSTKNEKPYHVVAFLDPRCMPRAWGWGDTEAEAMEEADRQVDAYLARHRDSVRPRAPKRWWSYIRFTHANPENDYSLWARTLEVIEEIAANAALSEKTRN